MIDEGPPRGPSTGWEALHAADWGGARAAFEAELAGRETAAGLDGLARALWWLSDIPGAIEAWEVGAAVGNVKNNRPELMERVGLL